MSTSASADRLARWLRRLRWPVVIVWVIAVVLLAPLASGLSKVTNDTAAAYLPGSAPSTRVAELQQGAPGQPETDPAVVLFTRGSGLTAADLAAASSARAAVAGLACRVRGLGAPGRPRRSADGQAVAFTAGVTAPANDVTTIDTNAVNAIQRAVSGPASRAGPGLHATVTGSAALNAASGISSKTQTKLLLAALVIVVIILLLVYRSPLLWLLPLFGAIGAIVLAKAVTHGLASAGLTVSSLSAAILTVLVLGAASDYALLLTHRYREELRQHAAAEDAMAAALRRTVPTLAASAATVICAMICLLAAESASLHGLGPVGAVGIATALLAQVTFLPALLLVFGRAAFWPRVPRAGQAGHEASRLWSGIGTRVARHPGWVTLVAALVLGGGVRQPGRGAHQQQPAGHGEGPAQQCDRGQPAGRALRAGHQRSGDRAGPAGGGQCRRRGGPGQPRRGHRHAQRAGRRLRQLHGHAVRAAVRRGRFGGHPGPAQSPGPRRAGLAGGRRAGHPVRHHPGRPARHLAAVPAGVRGHLRDHRDTAAGDRGAAGAGGQHRAQLRRRVRAGRPDLAARVWVRQRRGAAAAVHLHLPGRARGGLQHLPQRADPGRSRDAGHQARARCAGSASPAA